MPLASPRHGLNKFPFHNRYRTAITKQTLLWPVFVTQKTISLAFLELILYFRANTLTECSYKHVTEE
jgi:hypothetical protein